MSGSLAAAIAFGTFGVYYSSVWLLADALHPLRLLLAVGLFGFALLISELLHPVSVLDYLKLAWMAAGLGPWRPGLWAPPSTATKTAPEPS